MSNENTATVPHSKIAELRCSENNYNVLEVAVWSRRKFLKFYMQVTKWAILACPPSP